MCIYITLSTPLVMKCRLVITTSKSTIIGAGSVDGHLEQADLKIKSHCWGFPGVPPPTLPECTVKPVERKIRNPNQRGGHDKG